ncbi:uncharacterized protein LOC130736233 [Lotus japonicus]|uniref:uncharacterized protein LOC130736233 n=1 Tax=Lotus japonicus TaxID=34305 RepID=UPI00258D59FD|nr:uncharacterized protein LOC130736233 [Lotus japonicus]
MAPVYDKIASLNPIRDNWNILVRVIRLWTIRVRGQTTKIDMIIMDDKGETIALLQSNSLVPATIWNFVKFDDVLGGVLDVSLLVDVIGLLSRVGEQRNFAGGKKMKQIVLDSFGVELTCSFSGHYVDEIDRFLSTNDSTNVVVVIMCGKIKEFQGKRSFQNGLHCCKIMFNLAIPVALEFKESMAQRNPSPQQGVGRIVDASQVSLEDDFLNLHERKTLSDLKDPALDTIDNRDSSEPKISPEKVVQICDRNFGVGVDGVIFFLPGINGTDYTMRIFYSDDDTKAGMTHSRLLIMEEKEIMGMTDMCIIP